MERRGDTRWYCEPCGADSFVPLVQQPPKTKPTTYHEGDLYAAGDACADRNEIKALRTRIAELIKAYETTRAERDELKEDLADAENASSQYRAMRDAARREGIPKHSVTALVQAFEAHMHICERGNALDYDKSKSAVCRAIRAVVNEGSERK
jgi:regulator of replication initiation timing